MIPIIREVISDAVKSDIIPVIQDLERKIPTTAQIAGRRRHSSIAHCRCDAFSGSMKIEWSMSAGRTARCEQG